MPCQIPKELYYVAFGVNYRNVYDTDNNFIGEHTGWSSRPTAVTTGHIQINTPEGDKWVRGKAIYVEGMGIKMTEYIVERE